MKSFSTAFALTGVGGILSRMNLAPGHDTRHGQEASIAIKFIWFPFVLTDCRFFKVSFGRPERNERLLASLVGICERGLRFQDIR